MSPAAKVLQGKSTPFRHLEMQIRNVGTFGMCRVVTILAGTRQEKPTLKTLNKKKKKRGATLVGGPPLPGPTEPAPGDMIGPRTAGQENVFLHATAPSPSPSRLAHRPWILPWGHGSSQAPGVGARPHPANPGPALAQMLSVPASVRHKRMRGVHKMQPRESHPL